VKTVPLARVDGRRKTACLFWRATPRTQDGKGHRYWRVVENRRVNGGRVGQRQVRDLGEINASHRAAWGKRIEGLEEGAPWLRHMAIFPEPREAPEVSCAVVPVKLDGMRLERPRQWGACGLGVTRWECWALDAFWRARLGRPREGTDGRQGRKPWARYRRIDPGSEGRRHRQWDHRRAMADGLGEDAARGAPTPLDRCLDKRPAHNQAFFTHRKTRWEAVFQARFEVVRDALTSTYFECAVPETGKRRFGYRRDKRADGVPVGRALLVTPQGFPLADAVCGMATRLTARHGPPLSTRSRRRTDAPRASG
jgi:hypothetical protein